MAGLAVAGLAAPAVADHEQLPRGRQGTPYTVRAGDTASGLAVRFHAWTAELIEHNHLGAAGALHVGQRLEIPVVTSAVPTSQHDATSGGGGHHGTHHPDPSRERVRSTIAATARRHGVDPQLATAVSWQEAGWQMHHVSSAGAVGAMQVLPATGRWMEWYAGRPLHLHRLQDNAAAGVLLLGVLGDETRSRRHQVAAYYQGLGAVREHGLYDDTRGYVANVIAIKRRLEEGRPPA
jgi:hypothetical protein